MSHSPSQSLAPGPTCPLDEGSPKTYPQFILFGDSITQGASQVFQSSLSEWYQRRLDVINRGFSGYTAPAGYDTLVQFFPSHPPSSCSPRIRLLTIFFGANDACLPGSPQHVPLGEYKQSLRNILDYEGLKQHDTQPILIVPAPVDEWQLNGGDRNAATTARYADACREVAQEYSLPVLDLWTIFMLNAGWSQGQQGPLIGSRAAPKNPVLDQLLSDGLHFTPVGYKLVFDELVYLIIRELPDHRPENLPQIFPDWRFKLGVTG
ncbi:uncharacterized protein A1O9_11765 [Exophiala aquamarina CBS 119918]|uniref:SGNH hydrolase-type esterase domain-containing protein n=1 Tax=Exophiala aquamarina CBS 119918 TaxID=1182545 RepID=A0A072NW75_9EURO|nr:uncharacterized protein A1O9_11765 [Exophiala aquamarina CBS 119918]KEF52139.1 hypothetical protein A1O9_11765 [Exophiala aquamarina CBS 119918]